MKKILVLGSEGFIGSHIVERGIQLGWPIVGCDLIENPTQVYKYQKISLLSPDIEQLFESDSYDFCINAAGSGNVGYSIKHPFGDFESNTIAVAHVLEVIRRNSNKCRYLQISSAAVYGNPVSLPIKEDFSLNPLSPYGWNKWMSELLCKEYFQQFGVRSSIVRPFSVYGPGLRKQLFWDLYQKAAKSTNVVLFGTGFETRDFIFISDLIEALFKIIELSKFEADIYNIASGKSYSITEAVYLFFKNFSVMPSYSFGEEVKIGDPNNWVAEISKIKNLGFEPAINFEQGLDLTYKWINENF